VAVEIEALAPGMPVTVTGASGAPGPSSLAVVPPGAGG